MATDAKKANTGGAGDEKTAKAVDYAAQIGGSINKESAEKLFKGDARKVFDAVASAGGYGQFNDADYGGGVTLAVPADNTELRAKINEALKVLEF